MIPSTVCVRRRGRQARQGEVRQAREAGVEGPCEPGAQQALQGRARPAAAVAAAGAAAPCPCCCTLPLQSLLCSLLHLIACCLLQALPHTAAAAARPRTLAMSRLLVSKPLPTETSIFWAASTCATALVVTTCSREAQVSAHVGKAAHFRRDRHCGAPSLASHSPAWSSWRCGQRAQPPPLSPAGCCCGSPHSLRQGVNTSLSRQNPSPGGCSAPWLPSVRQAGP